MPLASAVAMVSPGTATGILLGLYRRHGMVINGTPNYVSSKIWFDGTDYSLITLEHGCTISSNIRILTHDWAAHTVIGDHSVSTPREPVGQIKAVRIGAHAFVGTGSIVMPGCDIGDHSIVAAGTVVRGSIPPYSLVVGSPGEIVGDTRDYLARKFPMAWDAVKSNFEPR